MKEEVWRDITGYEGLYQVSSMGNVKSKYKNGRLLKPAISYDGYKRVGLWDGKRQRYIGIHRLVASAFIPNPDNKPQVNHIDENKQNNEVSNLEWVTAKENINWGKSLKKRAIRQRTTQKNCKAVNQYDKKGNFIAAYVSCHEAARQTGFLKSGISHCCNNKPDFKSYKGYVWRYA